MPEVRTQVTFLCTGFNRTEEKDYFINPGNYGDDLMRWLIQALKDRGYVIEGEEKDQLGQEDFGWYFNFQVGSVSHTFLLARNEDEEDGWYGWLERNAGCLASLIGGRKRGILHEASSVIEETLASSERVSNQEWE